MSKMKVVQITLLICTIALGFFLPDLVRLITKNDHNINLDEYCIVSTTPCHQGDVSLTMQHDIVKPLAPSELVVRWHEPFSDTLQLSLRGLEMEMGIVKYRLSKQPDGSFSGTLLLPVCSQDAMTWFGTLSDGKSEIHLAIRMEK